jgi:membrane protein required for colicin V production
MVDASLTWFDAVVLAVIGLSILVAISRGLVRESLAIGVWIAAAAVAWLAFDLVRPLIAAEIGESWITDGTTMAAVFMVPWVVFKVLAAMISSALSLGVFGAIDRFLGAGFGLVRGVALVGAAYLGLALAIEPAKYPDGVRRSLMLPYVQDTAVLLAGWLPQDILAANSWQSLPGLAGGLRQTDFGARLFTSLDLPVRGVSSR